MNTGRIYKSKQAGNFTVIPNAILEDPRLSLKSIGLLCYILKLPPDWVLNKTSLYKNLKGGRDLVANAFGELEECGYIVRRKERGKSGAFVGYNYEVFDIPVTGLPKTGNPTTVKPITEKPKSGKASLIKKENTKENNTTKENKTKPQPVAAAPDPVVADSEPIRPVTQASIKKEISIYHQFIAIYDEWFKGFNDGVPPKYDQGNGNAAKSLITYFKTICSQQATSKKEVLDETGLNNKVLASWEFVLKNWGKLDNFTQGKTRLMDINSGIQNIITTIKNGHAKTNQQRTGGALTNNDLAGKIAGMYSGTGDTGSR